MNFPFTLFTEPRPDEQIRDPEKSDEDEPEEESWARPFLEDDERAGEHETWLAGILARQAEEAGLIQKTDDFSWEWHQKFDREIEDLQAQASVDGNAKDQAEYSEGNVDGATQALARPTQMTLADFTGHTRLPDSAPAAAAEAGREGGDAGGGFGGDFGGTFGINMNF